MDEDEDYDDGKRHRSSKRQKLLKEISNSRISAKALEDFLNSATRNDKTSALFPISPCDIKEGEFAQRYGMIKITETMPAYDRFRSIETSEETLMLIGDLVGEDVSYSTHFQGPVSGEQHDAPILDRLLRNLGRFTRPRPKQEQEPTYSATGQPASADHNPETGKEAADKEARSNLEVRNATTRRVASTAADQTGALRTPDAEKKSDFVIEYAAPVHLHAEEEEELLEKNSQDSSSSEDQADMFLIPQGSAGASPRQHADWKLYVYKTRHTMHGQELKVVDDLKTLVKPANLFQPAMYGIDELRETFRHPKEFRPPVYLLAHDSRSWFYGILEIDGFIKVKKGGIEPVSLKGFPEGSKTVNLKKFTPSITQSEVLLEFEVWKEEMEWADMRIPDGVHPVGRLFLRRDRRYDFPSLSGNQTLTDGQKRYFDGMLKILVGRRATKWSPEDARNAWETRKTLKTR